MTCERVVNPHSEPLLQRGRPHGFGKELSFEARQKKSGGSKVSIWNGELGKWMGGMRQIVERAET